MSARPLRSQLLAATALALLLPPLIGTATAQSRRAPATEAGYDLAFVDADVKRVVDAVLGSMLGVDYAVDPAVTGNVTLRTATPVRRTELIPLLESALRSVGAVLIVDGNRYRVVTRAAARAEARLTSPEPEASGGAMAAPPGPTDGPTPEIGPVAPGFASEVITLRAASAPQIAKLIEQFVGEEVVTSVEPALNRLVIAGSASERTVARQIIARFDVDTLAGMEFELYRLENVDAETLVDELGRVFQPPYDILGSRVRVVPLPRLRSLLVISANRADISRLEPWIRRLDAGVAGKRRLYSYAVQHGRARDIAGALQRVVGSGTDETAFQDDTPAPLLPAPTSGGGAADDSLPPPPARTRLTGSDARGGSGPRIVPNEATNALLIYADGEEYEFIRDALAKLDQPVAQVLIEATLAEVTLGDDFAYGINFRALTGDATIVNTSNNNLTPAAQAPGFSVSLLTGDITGVLNALQSKTNVRVLSAPKLMVLNNQTAELQVGDQVPIVTQQQQGVASPGAPLVNTIELRDTGVILKVTPRVNDSGTVTLDISQEVSEVAQTTTSGLDSPTIQQRRLSSTVATRSGQMIALGGLIRERSSRSRSGIPLLSQIPIIGGLFGRQEQLAGRTELIILLTPTVIRAPENVGAVVDELLGALDATRPLVERARETQLQPPVAPPPTP